MRNKLGQFVKRNSPTEIKCKVCNKVFYVILCRKNKAKYCSYKCYWKNRTGKPLSKETKRKIGEAQKGEKSSLWKGGKTKTSRGYIYVMKHGHPLSNGQNYVMQHKIIMEKHLGRYLSPKEVVHHINGIRDDNRLENLKLFANTTEHSKFHFPKNSFFGANKHLKTTG